MSHRWSQLPKSLALSALCLATSFGARAAPGDREALRRAIDQILAQQPMSTAHVSVEVTSLEDGQVVYARTPDDALNPASNTKLITSAAALLRLGPEYRFTTDYLADKPMARGRVGTLFVKGRGDPAINTERLAALVGDLWHRGLRSVGDIVLDDTTFDREQYGPGWEQESSDKSWAAGIGALSLNHNSVAIYITPADRAGQHARVEVEPDAKDYFTVESRVSTVRSNGRRKLRPHTFAQGERTRVVVDGRVALHGETVVMYRRVGDPTFYYGQVLKTLLRQRGIRVAGQVKRGTVPPSASLLESYESPELAEIVRDMNKVSSNFIAEMLVKTLGAELKGAPGTWPKGLEVTTELLAELGLPRGTYQLRNGSGLNDTNRFSAHQLSTLLQAVWKRFPVASEFIASLGIAARDGTMRMRMEGTDAAGRLRAKTGTLEHVTALSGFVQSLGGERFVFSILVNDWSGKAGPVLSSVDRMGGMLASTGAPEPFARDAALASLLSSGAVEAQPAELKARIATYASLATSADKKNLPFLRSALRTERDPLLRVAVADALYRSDPDQGGGPLLEALPASPDFFLRLRSVGRELSLPVPAVSSLLDLAVDGSGEALSRLLAIAPLARGPVRDEQLETLLTDGLVEVGEASPEELASALRLAPPAQSQAGVELVSAGLLQAGRDVSQYPLAATLKASAAAPAPGQASAWLAILERRDPSSASPGASVAPGTVASGAAGTNPAGPGSVAQGPVASAAPGASPTGAGGTSTGLASAVSTASSSSLAAAPAPARTAGSPAPTTGAAQATTASSPPAASSAVTAAPAAAAAGFPAVAGSAGSGGAASASAGNAGLAAPSPSAGGSNGSSGAANGSSRPSSNALTPAAATAPASTTPPPSIPTAATSIGGVPAAPSAPAAQVPAAAQAAAQPVAGAASAVTAPGGARATPAPSAAPQAAAVAPGPRTAEPAAASSRPGAPLATPATAIVPDRGR